MIEAPVLTVVLTIDSPVFLKALVALPKNPSGDASMSAALGVPGYDVGHRGRRQSNFRSRDASRRDRCDIGLQRSLTKVDAVGDGNVIGQLQQVERQRRRQVGLPPGESRPGASRGPDAARPERASGSQRRRAMQVQAIWRVQASALATRPPAKRSRLASSRRAHRRRPGGPGRTGPASWRRGHAVSHRAR